MMIALLFIITLMITLYAYQHTKLKLLSPTFWASAMTCFFSGIYVLTFSTMNNDISFLTLSVLLGSIVVTALGERVGVFVRFRVPNNRIVNSYPGVSNFNHEIVISPKATIVITFFYSIVAAVRFRNMLSYTGGSIRTIMAAMTKMRYIAMFTEERVVLSGNILNQIGFACEIAVFIHLFVFIHNLMTVRKKNWYLLIILIPDLIVRFLTTSRSAFLFLLFGAVFIWMYILVKQNRCREFRLTPKRLALIGVFFAVFYWYGQVRNTVSISMVDYIQMYTCSSIYNLDAILQKGWDKPPYFGYYTLQKLYSLLHINHTNIPSGLSMFVFNKNGYRSNIYTSLLKPLLDYGIGETLVIRFFESLLATKIIYSVLRKSEDHFSLYYTIYFMIVTLYCYANYVIGNRFIDYLEQPTLMLRYFVFGWLMTAFVFKPRVKGSSEPQTQ